MMSRGFCSKGQECQPRVVLVFFKSPKSSEEAMDRVRNLPGPKGHPLLEERVVWTMPSSCGCVPAICYTACVLPSLP